MKLGESFEDGEGRTCNLRTLGNFLWISKRNFVLIRLYGVNQVLVEVSEQWSHHKQSCKDITQHSMYKEMKEICYCQSLNWRIGAEVDRS